MTLVGEKRDGTEAIPPKAKSAILGGQLGDLPMRSAPTVAASYMARNNAYTFKTQGSALLPPGLSRLRRAVRLILENQANGRRSEK